MTTYPMKLTCTKCGATDEGTLHISDEPAREWVGLTDEERSAILDREFKQWWSRHDAVCRAIEAKLREKNGGNA